MTWGLQFVNAYGEEPLRPDGVVMGVRARGLCVAPERSGGVYVGIYFSEGGAYPDYGYFPPFAGDGIGTALSRWRFASLGPEVAEVPGSSDGHADSYRACPSPATDLRDMIFFQMPAGGFSTVADVWVEALGCRVTGLGLLDAAEEIEFAVATPDFAAMSRPGSYGLQTFDAGGALIYDSRAETIVVRDWHVFSADEIRSVLVDGVTLTWAPRVAPADPWIATAYNRSTRLLNGSRDASDLIIQWTGAAFTVSRRTYRSDYRSNWNAVVYQSLVIILAESEAAA